MEENFADVQFALFAHDVEQAMGPSIRSREVMAVEAWESISRVRWVSEDGSVVICTGNVALDLISTIRGDKDWTWMKDDATAGEIHEWVRTVMGEQGWTGYAAGDIIPAAVTPQFILGYGSLMAASMGLGIYSVQWWLA